MFAPEFLILLGVDIFLGGSILTVLLDKHFPTALPYLLDAAAMIGFGELLTGPTTITNVAPQLQFYYSFVYAMISVMTLFALNLYLLFMRKRPYESAMLGVFATVPSALGILYFTSAFVNGLSLSLPLVPVIPIEGVYIMFGLSVALIVFSLLVFGRKFSGVREELLPAPRETEGPIPAAAADRSGQELLFVPPVGEAAPPSTTAVVEPDQAPPPSDEVPAPPSEAEYDGTESAEGAEGAKYESSDLGGASGSLGERRSDAEGSRSEATVLLERRPKDDYAVRLGESIRFFEKAVDRPIKIDPALLSGVVKNARKAYITPSGMIMAEDPTGKPVTLSLKDLSTDEALNVMTETMRAIREKEGKGG